MKKQIYDIALQVGGSFYPAVGGQLLEQSILMAVKKCIELALANDDQQTALDIGLYFDIEIENERQNQDSGN
jgi:hypothetical protein